MPSMATTDLKVILARGVARVITANLGCRAFGQVMTGQVMTGQVMAGQVMAGQAVTG